LPHYEGFGVFDLFFRIELTRIARVSTVWAVARSGTLYPSAGSDLKIPLATLFRAFPAKVTIFVCLKGNGELIAEPVYIP
jgi:hypothetical protein